MDPNSNQQQQPTQPLQPNPVTPQPVPSVVIPTTSNLGVSSTQTTLWGVGKLFNESWNLYISRFGTLMGVSALAVLYSVLVGFIEGFFEQPAVSIVSTIILIALSLVTLVVELLSLAALIFAIKDSAEAIGIIEAYKRAWQKLLSFTWVAILTGLMIFAGFILFVIPGIIFLVWFWFSIFVVLDEDQIGFSAIKRSKNLVKGKWFTVSWRLFIISIVSTVVISLSEYLLGYFGSPAFLTTLVILVLTLLITPFTFVYYFLLYQQLKQTQ